MYKCKVGGTTSYSDKPCLGATRIEVEPSRGVSKLSGTERIGNDVFHERLDETFAEGVRPLTGMSAKQLKKAGQRNRLSPVDRQTCQLYDRALPLAEDEERHSTQPKLREVQTRLFQMRQRYQELGC